MIFTKATSITRNIVGGSLFFFWYTTRSDASQCTGWFKTFSDGYLSSEDSDKTLGCELGCMGIYQCHKLPSPNWKGWYSPKESFDHQIHGDTGWWFSPGCAARGRTNCGDNGGVKDIFHSPITNIHQYSIDIHQHPSRTVTLTGGFHRCARAGTSCAGSEGRQVGSPPEP